MRLLLLLVACFAGPLWAAPLPADIEAALLAARLPPTR